MAKEVKDSPAINPALNGKYEVVNTDAPAIRHSSLGLITWLTMPEDVAESLIKLKSGYLKRSGKKQGGE